MRSTLFTLMLFATTGALAATVYKWTDENGVIHYSDQPHENAEKVQLKAPQTYSAPKTPALPANRAGQVKPPPPPAPAYRSCEISEPVNDQMYMNTTTVTAAVLLQPAPRPGDQLAVTLDGQRVPGVPMEGGQFTISPVDRGTHSIQAAVLDSRGQPVCQSHSVTFHVHQPSLLAPVRPKG